MEAIILLIIGILGFVFIAPIILFIQQASARSDIYALRREVDELKKRMAAGGEPSAPQAARLSETRPQPEEKTSALPAAISPASAPAAEPRPQPAPQLQAEPAPSSPTWLENLTAGKIFSWIGGLLLFLGMIFAVKYSVENNLISPALRITAGAFVGVGLIILSFIIKDEKFKTTADTLCGAGLAALYGIIFSARYFYAFLSPASAFMLMACVSLASFWLATRRKAQYIGYLGLITGFLTPLLLNTGSKNYLMLFAYLAFINAGALAAALKEKWDKLIFTALGITFAFQMVWFMPSFSAGKIWDFCIIFASYTAAAAAAGFYFKEALPAAVRKALGFYIAGSFLFIFLTDMSLPAVALAFFINALLAALFYCSPRVYNAPFKIVNIAAFLLLAAWLCSAGGKAQDSIVLLMVSLLFTALNTLVAAAKNVREDAFSSSLPAAAILLLFLLPAADLWLLYGVGFIFTAWAAALALRAGNNKAACFAVIVFGLFLMRGIFGGPYYRGFGLFELAAGLLYTAGFLCALIFAAPLAGKNTKSVAVCAVLMPYIFLTAFILKNPSQEILGLIFCAGMSALALVGAYFGRDKSLPLIAAAGAFFPQIITAGGPPAGLNEYFALYLLIWAVFFVFPFILRAAGKGEDSANAWAAAALAACAPVAAAFINNGYINLSAASGLTALAYGAGAFFARGDEGAGEYFPVIAWFALFIFINVQIAHGYTPQETVVFAYDDNLAKTTAYTLAWGVYGMLTLFGGAGSRSRYGVAGGIGLVCLALLKLFVHDMWLLSTAYRVVISIAMAAVLIAGSFFYQAFTGMIRKK